MTTATRTRPKIGLTVRLEAIEQAAAPLFVGARDHTLDPPGFAAGARDAGLDALARYSEAVAGSARVVHPDTGAVPSRPSVFERLATDQRRDQYWRARMAQLFQATAGHPSIASRTRPS